jgi:hypothetical protein
MNISDEQYEEMENKIKELTGLLGFVIQGMFVTISRNNLNQFSKIYVGWTLRTMYDDEKVEIWMDKDEQ